MNAEKRARGAAGMLGHARAVLATTPARLASVRRAVDELLDASDVARRSDAEAARIARVVADALLGVAAVERAVDEVLCGRLDTSTLAASVLRAPTPPKARARRRRADANVIDLDARRRASEEA